MEMRVQIISNLFFPDELAGASLYTDLASYLQEGSHDVRVTTTFSYYPAWTLNEADRGVKVRDEVVSGTPVRRISMYVPGCPTGKGRLLSDLSFFWSLVRHGRYQNWRPEVVLTALPMLSQCLAQRFMHGFRRIPMLIIVQDFVVEAALELGILRIPFAAGLLQWIQRWALRSAGTLTTISPLMLEKLKFQIGNDRRLLMIPTSAQALHNMGTLHIRRRRTENTSTSSSEKVACWPSIWRESNYGSPALEKVPIAIDGVRHQVPSFTRTC